MVSKIKAEREKYKLNVTREMQESVKNILPLTDDEYDDFLTKNIQTKATYIELKIFQKNK